MWERIPITDEAHVGLAERRVRRAIAGVGFAERQLAEIDIVIRELGSNALKFGMGTGQFYYGPATVDAAPGGVEIVYTDKGPGIESTSNAIVDGYTTTGSLGT